MTPIEWIYLAVVLILSVAAYTMARKANQNNEATAGDFEATTAKEGETIPVVFGTVWKGSNVVWYGDVSTEAVRASGGKK